MNSLYVNRIPLENITLVRLNPKNKEHKNVIKELRDHKAKKMAFDIKQEAAKIERRTDVGFSFLVKEQEKYLGYIYW